MPPKRKRSASSAGESKKPSTRSKTRSSSKASSSSSKMATSSSTSSSPLQSFFQKLEQMSNRKKGKHMSKSASDRAMVTLLTVIIHRLIAECYRDDDSDNDGQQDRDSIAIFLSAIVECASRFLNSCEKTLLDHQVIHTSTSTSAPSSGNSNSNMVTMSMSVDGEAQESEVFAERFGRAIIHVTSGAVEVVASLCRDVRGRSLDELSAAAVLEEGSTEVEAVIIDMEEDMKIMYQQALWAATSAAERLVNMSSSSLVSNATHTHGGSALQSAILANLMWTGPTWDACIKVSESVFAKEEREDIMEWLRLIEDSAGSGITVSRRKVDGQHPALNDRYPTWLETPGAIRNSKTPSKKSKHGTKSRSSSNQHAQQKETAVKDDKDATLIVPHEAGMYLPLENSPSIRRWGSMAFVWLCRGQYRLLEAASVLLASKEYFVSIFDASLLRKEKDEVQVPGNVALVTFCARIADLVSDSGSGIRSSWQTKESFRKKSLLSNVEADDAVTTTTASTSESSSGRRRGSGRISSRRRGNTNTNTNSTAVASNESKSSTAGSSLTVPATCITRPNVLTIAAVFVRHLIIAHTACLAEGKGKLPKSECPNFVNIGPKSEILSKSSDTIKSLSKFYPWMNRTIDTVTKIAAASFIFSSTAKSSLTFRFTMLAAAVYLERVNENAAIDAKLLSLVGNRLVELAGKMKSYPFGTNDLISSEDLLISEPILPRADEDFHEERMAGEIGGVIPARHTTTPPGCEVLALFLRAFIPSCQENASTSPKSKRRRVSKSSPQNKVTEPNSLASAFLSKLFSVLERCYDFREEASSSGIDAKNCQMNIALDFTTAIRKHLLIPSDTDKKGCPLLPIIRGSLNASHLERIVDIGQIYTDTVVEKRLRNAATTDLKKAREDATSTLPPIPLPSSRGAAKGFTSLERRLWSSHIKLCLTIARGQSAFVSRRKLANITVVNDAQLRLHFIKAVAKVCGRPNDGWPLYISPVHHALVSTSIVSEPCPSSLKEAEPERFIVKSLIKSVEVKLNSFFENNNFVENKDPKNDGAVPSENMLLQLADARLIVIAFCRLPKKEQSKTISELIDVVHKYLVKNKASIVKICQASNSAVPTFLAKLITVVATIVEVSGADSALLESLESHVGPTLYHLPVVSASYGHSGDECAWYKRESCYMGVFSDWEFPSTPSTGEAVSDFESLSAEDFQKLCACYVVAIEVGFVSAKNDHCQLLFSGWNASGKSAMLNPNLNWTTWGLKPEKQTNDADKKNYVTKLLALREDMCSFHYSMDPLSTFPGTLLTLALKGRADPDQRASVRKSASTLLKTGISNTNTMINEALEDVLGRSDDSGDNAAAFALLESLTVHSSFLISYFTLNATDVDIFTGLMVQDEGKSPRKRRKKDRGISEETFESGVDASSDESGGGGYSDDEEDEDDARVDAFSRFHDVCVDLGAAPVHPDWLDATCTLRAGISASEASLAGQTIVDALVRVGNAALKHYHEALVRVIEIESSSTGKEGRMSQSCEDAVRLLAARLNHTDDGIHIPESDDPLDEKDAGPAASGTPIMQDINKWIGSACNIEPGVLSAALVNHAFDDDYHTAREAWFPNAAQRIRGKVQELGSTVEGWEATNAEQRAAGEWELLLSDCLFGVTVSTSSSRPSSANSVGINDTKVKVLSDNSAKKYLELAGRWKRLLIRTVDALVPATALFRFGLSDGKGRRAIHKQLLGHDEPAKLHIHFDNPHFGVPRGHNVTDSVSQALSFLCRLCCVDVSPAASTCQVAASHLVESYSDIVNLGKMSRLYIFLDALQAVKNVADEGEKSIKREALDAIQKLSHRIVLGIEKCADGVVPDAATMSSMESLLRNPISLQRSSTYEDLKTMKFSCILSFLGSPLNVTLIGTGAVDPIAVNIIQRLEPNTLTKTIFHSIARGNDIMSTSSRCALLRILNGTIEISQARNASIVTLVLSAWNWIKEDILKNMVKNDLCFFTRHTSYTAHNAYEVELCQLLIWFIYFLLGNLHPTSTPDANIGCQTVMKALVDTMHEWARVDCLSKQNIIYVVCLLGIHYNALKEVVGKNIALVDDSSADFEYFASLEILLRFLRELREISDRNNPPQPFRNAPDVVNQFLSIGHLAGQVVPNQQMIPAALTTGPPASRNTKSGVPYISTEGVPLPRTCSYVETGGDFTEQHWYNCYTCGLLKDKGCCSICAQVCHKGHDVGYSRRSSFFCDCGAENHTSDGQNRVSCKCLRPLSPKELKIVYGSIEGDDSNTLRTVVRYGANSAGVNSFELRRDQILQKALNMLSLMASLNDLIRYANGEKLLEELFSVFKARFMQKQKLITTPAFLRDIPLDGIGSTSGPVTLVMTDDPNMPYQQSLHFGVIPPPFNLSAPCMRNGAALELQQLKQHPLIPVRASRTSTFKVNNTDDRVRLGSASKYISQQCMVVDGRGRMIVAESNWLQFCSLIPTVNIRHVENPLSILDRASMCLIGKASVNFQVVGMQLCSTNDRLLVAWGSSEACILVLSRNYDAVEQNIDLIVELEPHECDTEYLLKCEWMPNSETHVVCICGTFIKVYDVQRANPASGTQTAFTARSTTCYSLAYEDVLVRAAVLIETSTSGITSLPNKEASEDEGIRSDTHPSTSVRLVILLDNGRLHTTMLGVDSNGDLEDQGEIYIECGDGLRFPTEGVRRYAGASPNASGATATSLGEGASLFYCKQSGLLLYKCNSSPLLAMKMGPCGITGSFELLPNTLKEKDVYDGSDDQQQSAHSPYTHWQELGIIKKDKKIIYRLACVARSSKSNKPKLLLLEVDEIDVKVQCLSWPLKGSLSYGIGLSSAIDGMGVFSAPFMVDGKDDGSVGDKGYFEERLFLIAMQSNGAMMIYGEDMIKRKASYEVKPFVEGGVKSDTTNSTTSLVKTLPKFLPQIFERLDLCRMDDLTLGGDIVPSSLGSDQTSLKQKLSIDNNSDFITCPSQGSNMTVTLRKPVVVSDKDVSSAKNDKDGAKDQRTKPEKDELLAAQHGHFTIPPDHTSRAIVAVRVLLGKNNTDFPREICVMGRTIKTKQRQERWYDLPLTEEEIIYGIRAGCVSIGFGRCYDESNISVIHAVEAYSKDRRLLPFLINRALVRNVSRGDTGDENSAAANAASRLEEERIDNSLIYSILNVTHTCRLLRVKVDPALVKRENLLKLIEMTALDLSGRDGVRRHVVLELVREVQCDSLEGQALVDEGTLMGVKSALSALRIHLNEKLAVDESESICGAMAATACNSEGVRYSLLSTLFQCLQLLLEMVVNRPQVYERMLRKLMEKKVISSSLVVESKEILDKIMENILSKSLEGAWKFSPPPPTVTSTAVPQIVDTANLNSVRGCLMEVGLHEIAMISLKSTSENDDGEKGSSSSRESEALQLGRFASFDLLASLLKSNDDHVVQTCCALLSRNKPTPSSGMIGTPHYSDAAINSTAEGDITGAGVISDLNPASRPMAYRCDGCHLIPITSVRYTLEVFDIDLCKRCYDAGSAYAASCLTGPTTPVQINGQTLAMSTGENLQIHHIRQMQAVAVDKLTREEIQQVQRNAGLSPGEIDEGEDDEDLQLALKMSLEESTSKQQEIGEKKVKSESLPPPKPLQLSQLGELWFDSLLDEAMKTTFFQLEGNQQEDNFGKKNPPSCGSNGANNLLRILLHLTLHADSDDISVKRGTKLSTKITKKLSCLVDKYLSSKDLSNKVSQHAHVSMILALKALASLLSSNANVISSATNAVPVPLRPLDQTQAAVAGNKEKTSNVSSGPQSKSRKTHPNFVCLHGAPAVRRKCSQGVNMNRRFYVCGLDRDNRCQYFKWADEGNDSKDNNSSIAMAFTHSPTPSSRSEMHGPQQGHNTEAFESLLLKLFSLSEGSPESRPLQSQLCIFLQNLQRKQDERISSVAVAAPVEEDKSSGRICKILENSRDIHSVTEDFHDGIHWSKEKVRGLVWNGLPLSKFKDSVDPEAQNKSEGNATDDSALIQSSLDLLALLATNSLQKRSSDKGTKPAWDIGWFNFLCSIISTTSSSSLQQRSRAKRMLKRLCGGRKTTYHRVRDHHVFSIQYKSLLLHCNGPLQDALDVKEKARMCGTNWKASAITWDTLAPGGLLGIEGLISEDSLSLKDSEKLNTVLDDLAESTKSRGRNWRQFCTSTDIPIASQSNDLSISASPLRVLLWMACSLSGSNQMKVLDLIDVALTNFDGKEEAKSSNASFFGSENESAGDKSLWMSSVQDSSSSGTQVSEVLTVDEMSCFMQQFVLRGRSTEFRRVASRVVQKMLKSFSPENIIEVLERAMGTPMKEVGVMGESGCEYVGLLQNVIFEHGRREGLKLDLVAKIAFSCCGEQLKAISSHYNADAGFVDASADPECEIPKKRFDLASCVHCQKLCGSEVTYMPIVVTAKNGGIRTHNIFKKRVLSSGAKKSKSVGAWDAAQVRPFTKSRLESSTENLVSTEFATHVQLKFRLAISEIHVNITDPRGRLVKNIGVSFTPRQVSDPNELKSTEYAEMWQRCGTITLGRGMGKGSCRLHTSIVAANLKFEFLDFHEKAGGAKSEDGAMLLTCPRCTRIVNNAAGVCGHCGEVAFQCRKCRHINYDRLDAFLCVECGYCASGSFSYEVNAGVASNAVAIIDDEGNERALKLLRVASKRLVDTRGVLRKKLLSTLIARRKRNDETIEDLSSYSKYPSALKRSLFGDTPKSGGKANGDSKKRKTGRDSSSGRSNLSTSRISAAQKARSLLNLAQQLRNESSASSLNVGRISNDRAMRGDFLVRQAFLNATGGGGIDFFDDEATGSSGAMGDVERDIFSMLGSSGGGNAGNSMLQSDVAGSLSRIVASIQNRSRGGPATATGTSNSSSNGGNDKSSRGKNNDVQANSGSSGKASGSGAGANSKGKPISGKALMEECTSLQQQMKEADRECYELEKTISAWKRLNEDALSNLGALSLPSSAYVPTSCHSCGVSVALQFMALLLCLLQTDMKQAESSLTREFVNHLFFDLVRNEDQGDANTWKELEDLKRTTIIFIAVQSQRGGAFVLEELRLRLKVGHDAKCAKILGMLIEKDFPHSEKFIQLAMNVLDGNLSGH